MTFWGDNILDAMLEEDRRVAQLNKERKYGYSEIEALRAACRSKMERNCFSRANEDWTLRSEIQALSEVARIVALEEMVRTYILAGVFADQLIAGETVAFAADAPNRERRKANEELNRDQFRRVVYDRAVNSQSNRRIDK